MSKVRLLGAEAWASIRQNLSTTVASTLTVLIGMVLLGLFIAFFTLVLSWSSYVQKQLQVHVYFCTTVSMPDCSADATQAQEQAVKTELLRNPHVKQVIFVSKEEALAQVKRDFPDMFVGGGILPSNPEPDSWDVIPAEPKYTPELGKAICAAHFAGVEKCPRAGTRHFGDAGGVHWGRTPTNRILTIARWIWITFLVGAILLVIASTLLIANTIRLSIFARRREIEVMKLVGASNWFIRGPFVLEGFLVGILGSFLAVVLLGLGKVIVLPAINWHVTEAHAWPFTLDAILLLGAGLTLGAIGSGMTLRKFLQV